MYVGNCHFIATHFSYSIVSSSGKKKFNLIYRVNYALLCRFYTMDWKEWRQAYKTLIVLEFLLTHGPELDMFEEFHCDLNTIHDLEDFTYVDEKGWVNYIRARSIINQLERYIRKFNFLNPLLSIYFMFSCSASTGVHA